jgi:hypothetical protein
MENNKIEKCIVCDKKILEPYEQAYCGLKHYMWIRSYYIELSIGYQLQYSTECIPLHIIGQLIHLTCDLLRTDKLEKLWK